MAVIELNQDTIEIKRLSHSMSRASICSFVLNIVSDGGGDIGEPVDIDDSDAKFSLGDTELLETRREVRYTADDGTILFAGKVLPAKRNIGTGNDQVVYTAADIVEFLGNNPCDAVNKYYNRNRNDSIVFDYPQDQTVEQIVNAEFARLIGSPGSDSDHHIEAVDWSKAEDLRNLVVYDFKTEGKTWLQLLDDLRDEIPMLAYWFDPRECDRSNDIRGYTLRFFNLSPTSDGDDAPDDDERVRIVHPMRDGNASPKRENVMNFRFEEDISRSYDKLTIKAWGHLYERYEKMELAWDQGIGAEGAGSFSNPDSYPDEFDQKRVHPLRLNPETGAWERYSDAGGGNWFGPANLWTPTRDTQEARRAFRRYKTPDKPGGEPRRAINFKAELQDIAGGNSQLVPVGPASEIEVLSHVWYTGPLTFTVGSNTYVGVLLDGVKVVVFTGGVVNDWGDVEPSRTYYPDYPDGPDGFNSDPVPRFIVGSPSLVEENYIFLSTPLIRETNYIFTGNIDGSGWNNMIGERVSLFWGVGYDLWCYYTAWDELEVVRENNLFGYEKELVLYEPRFFKYTNLAGEVLRDDTAPLNEFADLLFELIVKPRHFGNATLDVTELDDGAEVFNNRTNDRDIFMGSPIQIENWKPGSQYTLYRPDVFIQSMELSKYDSEKTIDIGFDNPQTYIPLENTQRFRSFFETAFNNGIGGTNSIGGCGCGPDPATTTTATRPTTTTPPPTSTGTDTPPTTTPPTSSSGTTATSSTSDTTQSTSTTSGTDTNTTQPPGSTTTTTTTPTTTTNTTTTASTTNSTTRTKSVTTVTTGPEALREQENSTSTTSTTPQPAEIFTGVPYENQ